MPSPSRPAPYPIPYGEPPWPQSIPPPVKTNTLMLSGLVGCMRLHDQLVCQEHLSDAGMQELRRTRGNIDNAKRLHPALYAEALALYAEFNASNEAATRRLSKHVERDVEGRMASITRRELDLARKEKEAEKELQEVREYRESSRRIERAALDAEKLAKEEKLRYEKLLAGLDEEIEKRVAKKLSDIFYRQVVRSKGDRPRDLILDDPEPPPFIPNEPEPELKSISTEVDVLNEIPTLHGDDAYETFVSRVNEARRMSVEDRPLPPPTPLPDDVQRILTGFRSALPTGAGITVTPAILNVIRNVITRHE